VQGSHNRCRCGLRALKFTSFVRCAREPARGFWGNLGQLRVDMRGASDVTLRLSALGVVLLASCTFDPLPDVNGHEEPVDHPVGWIATLDVSPPPANVPVPGARSDDVTRPLPATAQSEAPPRLRKLFTEHLGQWTARAPNRVDALGFNGTDLGVSFAHQGELWFLFGDSQSVFDYCSDSLAHLPLEPLPRDALPKLNWLTRPSGLFEPLTVPGLDLGFMNVAVDGLSIDDRAYVFFATGWSEQLQRHSGSALAHSRAPGSEPFQLDHAVDSAKFINVSALVEGEYVYIWGSGQFRKSDVYLARVRKDALAQRAAWEYFRGWRSEGPTFGPDEAQATPLVSAGCVGELSARKHPQLGLYMLAYNCERPRGVFLRTASDPAGPYSAPITLFEPWRDAGYEHFIHAAPTLSGRDDGLSDPGREEQSGGEYGAYLVPQWFTEESPGVYGVVYTLSSWNPYQVHVMRTLLADATGPWLPPFVDGPRAPEGMVMLSAGDPTFAALDTWTHAGDGGSMSTASDGLLVMSSEVPPLGAAATGTFWRDFSVDASVSSLEFEVQGEAEVLLMADDEVVRRVRGEGASVWRPVVLRLDELRGKRLRLALYDRATDAFVAVRNPQLR
jgi:hypothetical protein